MSTVDLANTRALRWIDVLAQAALCLSVVAVILFAIVQPAEYHAQVTMEVRRQGSRPYYCYPPADGSIDDPQFRTTFQILRAPKVLNPVIEKLKLVEAYSKQGRRLSLEQVFRRLKGDMVLSEVPGTDLIEIGVYNTEPGLAADIANAIYTVYRDERLGALQSAFEEALKQFKDEVAKQQKAVDDAAAAMAQLVEQSGLVDPDRDNAFSKVTVKAEGGLSEGRMEKEKLEAYAGAKARYLQQRKILEAAEMRLAAARMEKGIDFRPVALWRRAEPPAKPASSHYMRRWHVLGRRWLD
jgi:capsular polysaccharide biosynthesis protein